MGKVIRIAELRDREIVQVLQHFLERAEKGELKGLAVCIKDSSDREDIAVAGDYRADPAHAVNVAMRMSWRLTQMQDEKVSG